MGRLLALLVMFFPSRLKIVALRMLGHDVHGSARIGFSYLNARHIVLGPNSYVGSGNIITLLGHLELRRGARLNRWNRITSNPAYDGRFILGERSSVSLRHYFDVCDRVEIGHDTIVGGQRSTFYTHSKGVEVVDYTAPVVISDWCYVGSNVNVAPGAVLGSHCFLGMGSVLVGDRSAETYALLAGNPARVRKQLPRDAAYFQQGPLRHAHTEE